MVDNHNTALGHRTILLVEDDEDDFVLTRDALAATGITPDVKWVRDGDEALHYLRRTGPYERDEAPRPDLVLLDLNMPRKSGREVLTELKADPELRAIPVVVFTTSEAPEDIIRSYATGGNSFIQKPIDFEQFVHVLTQVTQYWFQIVRLPR